MEKLGSSSSCSHTLRVVLKLLLMKANIIRCASKLFK